eukprot:tig00021339_g20378.t1
MVEGIREEHARDLRALQERVEWYEAEFIRVRRREEEMRGEAAEAQRTIDNLEAKWREYHENNKTLVGLLKEAEALEKERRAEVDAQRNAVEENNKLKGHLEFTKRALNALKEEHVQVSSQYREKLREDTLRVAHSPRPDWHAAPLYVPALSLDGDGDDGATATAAAAAGKGEEEEDGGGSVARALEETTVASSRREERSSGLAGARSVPASMASLAGLLPAMSLRTAASTARGGPEEAAEANPGGKSSAEIARMLMDELDQLRRLTIGPALYGASGRPVIGLGTRPQVPAHLRAAGRVRRVRPERRALLEIIKATYDAKRAAPKEKMLHHLANALQALYPDERERLEVAYAVHFAAERSTEPELATFRDALAADAVPENVQDVRAFVEGVRSLLVTIDEAHPGGTPKDVLAGALRDYFPLKSAHDLAALRAAMDEDVPGRDRLHCFDLIPHPPEPPPPPAPIDWLQGRTGRLRFLELLLDQHALESSELLAAIEDQLSALDFRGSGKVSGSDVRKTLLRLDPDRGEQEWDVVLARVLGCKTGELNTKLTVKPVVVADFVRRLRLVAVVVKVAHPVRRDGPAGPKDKEKDKEKEKAQPDAKEAKGG